MTAGDLECPKCGHGFRDIAPDLNVGRREDVIGTPSAITCFGHCKTGHRIAITSYGDDSPPTVTVLDK